MHRSNDELEVMFEAGGASVRSLPAGGMFTSIVEVPAGVDFTDALKGLPDDSEETTTAGEVFHWPAGHTAWSPDGARFVEVSPERDAVALLDHMNAARS